MDADHEWIDALEDDLYALANADADLDRDAEVAERIRIERAGLGLFDRLVAARGLVEVAVASGVRLQGEVVDGSDQWLLLGTASVPLSQALVPKAAVVWIRGIQGRSTSRGAAPTRSIASVFREWVRDRAEVRIHVSDGSIINGLLGAAFSDHLDVVAHDGQPYAIPFSSVLIVTRVFD